MTEEQRVLDLDQLFGDARPIKVKWKGETYNLLRLDAFSPREINMIGKLQADSAELQRLRNSSENNDGKVDKKIEALMDKILKMLCAELPLNDMPFLAKTNTVTFYIEETQGKKVLEAAMTGKPIGETPSAS